MRRWFTPLVAISICLVSCRAPAPPSSASSPTGRGVARELAPAPSIDEVKNALIRRMNQHDGAGVFELFAPSMREVVPLADAVGVVERALAKKGLIATSASETETLTKTQLRFREESEFYDRIRVICEQRGWTDCVAIATEKRFVKLNVTYRALKSLALGDVGEARRGFRLLREL